MTDALPGRSPAAAVEAGMRGMLRERPGRPLPPVRAWAREHRTSTRVVLRVLHALRDEGLVDVRRGRRASAPSAVRDPEPTRSPVRRVYDAVRGAIEGGRFPVGTRLPKTEYFAVQERASYSTVVRALRLLEREHLVHRHGRHSIAGPAPSSSATQVSGGGPVILLLQANEEWWEETLASPWLSPFSLGLMREVLQAGVQTIPATLARTSSSYLCRGHEQIASLIRELGPRYHGTVMMGQSWDFHFGAGATIPAVVRAMVRYGRPVVWFDYADEPRSRSDPFDPADYRRMTGEPGPRRFFSRVHHSESAAHTEALRALYSQGHRRVGLPWFTEEDPLLRAERVGGLLATAAALPGMELVVHTCEGNPFGTERGPAPVPVIAPAWLRRLGNEGRRFLESAPGQHGTVAEHARLLRLAEVLLALRFERGVTAIIAINDTRARDYYLCLRSMGLRVPQDLSLVSFDASPRVLYPWQISSVDFGFAYLAYCAYHLIMQDVPVRRNRTNVPARCRLNHMGSIGASPAAFSMPRSPATSST